MSIEQFLDVTLPLALQVRTHFLLGECLLNVHRPRLSVLQVCLFQWRALLVTQIYLIGFGKSVSANDEVAPGPGRTYTFREALQIVSMDVFIQVVAGDWFPGITHRIRRVRVAFGDLKVRRFLLTNMTLTLSGPVLYAGTHR